MIGTIFKIIFGLYLIFVIIFVAISGLLIAVGCYLEVNNQILPDWIKSILTFSNNNIILIFIPILVVGVAWIIYTIILEIKEAIE